MKLPVSSIKPYLNKALVFINQTKIGINPAFGCLMLVGDKGYVNNGDTGAILSLPFTVEEPTVFFPFEMAKVINLTNDAAEVEIKFNYTTLTFEVKTPDIKIKRQLIPPAIPLPVIPTDLKLVTIEGIYEKIRGSGFATSIDASLEIIQATKVHEDCICATNQIVVWKEKISSEIPFLIPKLLRENMERLAMEPTGIATNDDSIFIYYPDLIVYATKLAKEASYPDVRGLFAKVISGAPNKAVVTYDREALTQKLRTLLALPQPETAVRVKCTAGILTVENYINDSAENKESADAVISMEVKCAEDFTNVVVNSEHFMAGVERFSTFALKEDGKRLLFSNPTQEYCISRRDVR